jgi:2-iminobutanoate/2-iminopropanoate deaminase
VRAGGFLFVSGQIPLDPATGQLVSGDDVAAQTRQVMDNLSAILRAAGSSFERVVKVTIYLLDMNDFQTVNGIYAAYIQGIAPARATIQVAGLPLGARVEVELVALDA